MTEKALEAPCGIHCGLCPLNKALGDENLKAVLAERLKLPLERAGCRGCRAVDGHCPVIGEQCATWMCVQSKGVEFCSDCGEFPCVKLMPCSDRAVILPHNIKVFSLALRKARGREEWEREIAEVYRLYFEGKMAIGRGPTAKD